MKESLRRPPVAIPTRKQVAPIPDGITAVLNQAAWEQLVRYACSFCRERHDAEDVVQTVLLRIVRLWGLGEHDESEVLPYCLAGVRNEAIKVAERRRPFVPFWDLEQRLVRESDPERSLIRSETWAALLQAVDSLPMRSRQCFTIVRLLDTRRETAAEELGISEKTVENHLRRAERKLRRLVRELGDM